MTITNGYCTLEQLSSVLDMGTVSSYDTELELVIESISRGIDDYCSRRFYTTDADETRYFTAISNNECKIDELLSITSLKTDDDLDGTYEITWASGDYNLFPYNASQYSFIETTPLGSYLFLKNARKNVQVVGKFGYSATAPKNITQACIMQSERFFKRRDAPLGIAGTTQFGLVKLIGDFDPDVQFFLRPFVRYT